MHSQHALKMLPLKVFFFLNTMDFKIWLNAKLLKQKKKLMTCQSIAKLHGGAINILANPQIQIVHEVQADQDS